MNEITNRYDIELLYDNYIIIKDALKKALPVSTPMPAGTRGNSEAQESVVVEEMRSDDNVQEVLVDDIETVVDVKSETKDKT